MSFSQKTINKVWNKANKVSQDAESKGFRKDQCTAWILFSAYGDRGNLYGWEIDHIKPKDSGGSDAVSNLRPLHWKNNAAKSSGRLVCAVKSDGNKNTG